LPGSDSRRTMLAKLSAFARISVSPLLANSGPNVA
jgi:hypothetical protein